MIRRAFAGLLAAALLPLAACGDSGTAPAAKGGASGEPLVFAILPAENQQSMEPLWRPLLDDMSKEIGRPVEAKFITNYSSMIQAMAFDQVQLGWFSALPALEATRRADGEVLGRVVGAGGEAMSYRSVLLVRKDSGITLDKLLQCGKKYSFGIGDAKSTSGTLAPMAYLFTARGIDPSACFSTVRSANHQANTFSVANGVLDVATGNTVGIVFAKRQNPALADRLQVIWESPPLPESGIVVRKDVDPATKEKIRSFFLTYGKEPGPRGDAQRKVLDGLTYGGFEAADASYLDPVRKMEASTALATARKGGDPARIAAAQKAYDAIPGA